MQRRRFLTLTGLSLGAASTVLSSRASASSANGAQKLTEITERAEKAGKPLVLIPVPSNESDREAVQRAWGELFSAPNDEQLSMLALFEFAFAEIPAGTPFKEDSHCALFRFKADRAWQPITLVEGDPLQPSTLFHSLKRALAATVEQRGALIQSLHAAQHHGSLFAVSNARPNTAPRLKLEEADLGAAILFDRIETSKDDAFKRWGWGVLASTAALRLYESDPSGAHWKTTYPKIDPCPPCGMAIVQGSSKLFLDAYTSKKR